MNTHSQPHNATIDRLYRQQSRRILATLIKLLGDFDLAEEALHEAFNAAITQWPHEGVPDNPRAWLITTGRFKAIDQQRRRARHSQLAEQLAAEPPSNQTDVFTDDDRLPDDRLRLIFTCCHPGLAHEAQVALTLRELCDLTTEQIARAFLVKPATIAQRIVRAKRKIRTAGIPYEVPGPADLNGRLQSVLQVIYLVFNEGHSASEGRNLTQEALAEEALRLGLVLEKLLPHSEVTGCVALMQLTHARRRARTDAAGDIIPLEYQDRTLWDGEAIRAGAARAEQALQSGPPGPYSLQAAIAACHSEAPRWQDTDWAQIVGLFDLLLSAQPSPVVALNRAVALSYWRDPATALAELEPLLIEGELDGYQPAHLARADLLERLGRRREAAEAWRRALALTRQTPQRRYIEKRLNRL